MNPCLVGIDVGGTHTRVGLIARDASLVAARRWPTPAEPGGAALLEGLADSIGELLAEHAAGGRPTAIGLAVPGLLDEQRTGVLRAVNLPFLEGVPLGKQLAERTGCPVTLETDVAAAAWGEWSALPHRPRRLVFLAIGTGIGAGAILEGRVVRHTHGGAGHLGQMIVDSSPDAPRGACGTAGCLEAWVSGPALERAARAAGLASSLTELSAACRQDDGRANAIVDQAARFLGIGLVNVSSLYAPNAIVIGGGAARALPELIGRAGEALRSLGGVLVPPELEIGASTLGDDAGMIGAALLASTEGGGRQHAR